MYRKFLLFLIKVQILYLIGERVGGICKPVDTFKIIIRILAYLIRKYVCVCKYHRSAFTEDNRALSIILLIANFKLQIFHLVSIRCVIVPTIVYTRTYRKIDTRGYDIINNLHHVSRIKNNIAYRRTKTFGLETISKMKRYIFRNVPAVSKYMKHLCIFFETNLKDKYYSFVIQMYIRYHSS